MTKKKNQPERFYNENSNINDLQYSTEYYDLKSLRS